MHYSEREAIPKMIQGIKLIENLQAKATCIGQIIA